MSLATRVSLLAACAVGLSVSMASIAAYVTLRRPAARPAGPHPARTRTTQGRRQPASSATRHDPQLPLEVLGAADLRVVLHLRRRQPCSQQQPPTWIDAHRQPRSGSPTASSSETLRTITINGTRVPRRHRPCRRRWRADVRPVHRLDRADPRPDGPGALPRRRRRHRGRRDHRPGRRPVGADPGTPAERRRRAHRPRPRSSRRSRSPATTSWPASPRPSTR